MNNLFRINQNNVQDFLDNYNKSTYKTIKNSSTKVNNKTKITNKPKSKPYPTLNNISNQISMQNQIQLQNINQINKKGLELEHDIEKKYNYNYNYENIKKKDEIEIDFKNKNIITNNNNIIGNNKNTFQINNSVNEIGNKIFSQNNVTIKKKESKSGEKILWEFGKSGIKMEKLKKPMVKNLAILSYVHKIFVDFIDRNKSVNLSEVFEHFKTKSDNIDKPIYSSSKGNLNILANSIYLNLDKKKISGMYKLVDCGYVKLFDSNITEEYLRKNKIPNLDSILSHSDNIKHFSKIIKIFNNPNLFKSKSNSMGELNWINLINEFLPEILLNFDEKKDIFDFESKKFSFYIKIYETHSKAFVIDKNTKLIYFINTLENYSKNNGYLFFYVCELDSKYKIITYSMEEIKNKLENKKQLEQDSLELQEQQEQIELQQEQKSNLEQELQVIKELNEKDEKSFDISSIEQISTENESKYKCDSLSTLSTLSTFSAFSTF